MRVKINSFFHKSITFAGASQSGLTPEELRKRVEENLRFKEIGDKPGTFVVPLKGSFKSPTLPITEGLEILSVFEARREGEDKFMEHSAPGAEYATVDNGEAILYEVTTLKKDCERETEKALERAIATGGDLQDLPDPRSFFEEGDHEFELVIFKSPAKEPGGLAMMVRNQLALKGGTPAKYTSEQWCEAAHFALTHVKVG